MIALRLVLHITFLRMKYTVKSWLSIIYCMKIKT